MPIQLLLPASPLPDLSQNVVWPDQTSLQSVFGRFHPASPAFFDSPALLCSLLFPWEACPAPVLTGGYLFSCSMPGFFCFGRSGRHEQTVIIAKAFFVAFYLSGKAFAFIITFPAQAVEKNIPITQPSRNFRTKLCPCRSLSSDDWSNVGLADADNSVFYLSTAGLKHLPLLSVKFTDH